MRVNVYSQELTDRVDLVEKLGAGAERYSAIQFELHSSGMLHDDDRSAVTFWLPRSRERREALAQAFERAATLVRVGGDRDMTEETFSDDFNEVWVNRPASPVGDREFEVTVVAKRCVYLNNHRIAGGKPYATGGLPQHTLKSSLAEVIDAFSEEDIIAALKERAEVRAYFARYHAWRAAREKA